MKNEIINMVCNNKIVILVGETGSGKTTQLV
jgi:HrpA-like RNA helicase